MTGCLVKRTKNTWSIVLTTGYKLSSNNKTRPIQKWITIKGEKEEAEQKLKELIDDYNNKFNDQITLDKLNIQYNTPGTISSLESKDIYIIESSGLYKIGVTKNIEKRFKHLNTGNPNMINKVKVYKSISNAHQIETMIHNDLKQYRHKGEWFNCDLNLIFSIVDKYTQK